MIILKKLIAIITPDIIDLSSMSKSPRLELDELIEEFKRQLDTLKKELRKEKTVMSNLIAMRDDYHSQTLEKWKYPEIDIQYLESQIEEMNREHSTVEQRQIKLLDSLDALEGLKSMREK